MKEYIVDCVELVKKHKRFLIKAYLLIMAIYAAMAALVVYWDQISTWFQKFRSGKCCLKWNPGRLGHLCSYDTDESSTSGGLDADEADE